MGYEFLGWTGTGIIEPEKTVTIEKGSHGNREYTANWKAEEKTLKFDPNGGEGKTGRQGYLQRRPIMTAPLPSLIHLRGSTILSSFGKMKAGINTYPDMSIKCETIRSSKPCGSLYSMS